MRSAASSSRSPEPGTVPALRARLREVLLVRAFVVRWPRRRRAPSSPAAYSAMGPSIVGCLANLSYNKKLPGVHTLDDFTLQKHADGETETCPGVSWGELQRAYQELCRAELRSRQRAKAAAGSPEAVAFETEIENAYTTGFDRSFDGAINGGKHGHDGTCCTAAFPSGRYRKEWQELEQRAREGTVSTAAMFQHTSDPRRGTHVRNPDEPGHPCYCQKIYGEVMPWGCAWFGRTYVNNIEKARGFGQTLVVFYNAGHLARYGAEGSSFPS